MASIVTTMMTVNEQERVKERQVYEDRRKKEDQRRNEAEKARQAQRKLDDEKRAGEQRDDIKRLEKLKERRYSDQQKNELLILKMMQHLYRETTAQPQPLPSTPHVTMPLQSPPLHPILGASQTITSDMVASLNEIKSNDDITVATKKSKQHHSMDYKADHPKLTIPPQAVNMKENPSQPFPPGGRQ